MFGSSLLCSSLCLGQTQGSGCRSLSEQIWYDEVPPLHAHGAKVMRVEAKTGSTIVTVGLNPGIYSTSDYGKHWTLVRDFPNGIVAPSDPSIMYSYKTNGVIIRSQDGGKTWVLPTPRIEGASASDTAYRVSGDHSYVLEFDIAAVDPLKPLTLYATVSVGPPRRPGGNPGEQYVLRGMYVSDDGGENWKQFSDQVGIFDKYWRPVTLGISPAQPDVMFSKGEHGVLRSADGGKTWRPVGQSEQLNLVTLDTEDQAEGIFISTKQTPLNVDQFVFDTADTRTIYMVSGKGIHRSLDGGDSWTILDLGFDRLRAVNSFAVDPLRPNRVIAGTALGLFMSEDQGCHFVKMLMPEQ